MSVSSCCITNHPQILWHIIIITIYYFTHTPAGQPGCSASDCVLADGNWQLCFKLKACGLASALCDTFILEPVSYPRHVLPTAMAEVPVNVPHGTGTAYDFFHVTHVFTFHWTNQVTWPNPTKDNGVGQYILPQWKGMEWIFCEH